MKIAVIGGDKRMLFAARAFADDGHEVAVAGFDDLTSLCEIRILSVADAVRWADIIILPVRPVKDGFLNAPFTKTEFPITDLLDRVGEKPIFAGGIAPLKPYAKGKLCDYAALEYFSLYNAELTAEGALSILLSDYEDSVFGTKILVTGYGRIGKLLSAQLHCLGAEVTVAARKALDRERAELSGLPAVDYPDIDHSAYPVIINTVPALVLDRKAVDRMREDVFLIDLASAPGGVDFARARERGLSVIHALSLPGKTAPYAAGRVIKNAVMNILSKEIPLI